MVNYTQKYTSSLFEAVLIKEITNNFGSSVYGRCFMDASSSAHWVDFYTEYFQAALTTVITKDTFLLKYLTNRYELSPIVDVLPSPLQERIGIFENQYDVITAFAAVDTIVDDSIWQETLKNFCFYLKPGGLLLVSGDFTDTGLVSPTLKTRSKALWNAFVRNNGCIIKSIHNNKLYFGGLQGSILVIKKNERHKISNI